MCLAPAAMLKIGKKVTASGIPSDGTGALIDGWESNFADSMPSNERVAQLLDLDGVRASRQISRASCPAFGPICPHEWLWPARAVAIAGQLFVRLRIAR
jgi:hypothetical protein